jgi:capsular polysaccharide biosynthesis protein
VVEVPPGIIRLRNVWVAPLGLSRIDEFRGRAFDRILALAARVSDLPRTSPRRIFVSRLASRHRRLRNEREVQAVASARGFAVVQPETMPVADQIRLFRGAEVVLGVFGAGLTNAAFMRPGGTLLEIAPSRRATPPVVHNAIFSSLAGSVGLRYGLVSAPSASIDAETHDFTVPLDWLEHLLDEMTAT